MIVCNIHRFVMEYITYLNYVLINLSNLSKFDFFFLIDIIFL